MKKHVTENLEKDWFFFVKNPNLLNAINWQSLNKDNLPFSMICELKNSLRNSNLEKKFDKSIAISHHLVQSLPRNQAELFHKSLKITYPHLFTIQFVPFYVLSSAITFFWVTGFENNVEIEADIGKLTADQTNVDILKETLELAL